MAKINAEPEYKTAFIKHYMILLIHHDRLKNLKNLNRENIYEFKANCYMRESLVNAYYGLEMWNQGNNNGKVLKPADFGCENLTGELLDIFIHKK